MSHPTRRTVVAAALAGPLVVAASPLLAQEATPAPEEIEAIVRAFYEPFNTGDTSAYDTILADPRASLVHAPKDTGLAMHFLVTPWVAPSGACYRADFLRRRPFDEHYLDADVLTAYLALLGGESLLFTRESLVHKREHAASCSSHSRRTAIYHFTYARTFRIVTAHGGSIRLMDTERGTQFRIEIPDRVR